MRRSESPEPTIEVCRADCGRRERSRRNHSFKEKHMIQRLQVKRNEKGFTLIELLIVIIVLGILAAIVVFAVGTTRDDAKASACKTDVKSVQLSAEAMKTTGGKYPVADPA